MSPLPPPPTLPPSGWGAQSLSLRRWRALRPPGSCEVATLPPLLRVIYGSDVRVCLKSAAEFILSATYSAIISHRKSAKERVVNGRDLRGSKNTGTNEGKLNPLPAWLFTSWADTRHHPGGRGP